MTNINYFKNFIVRLDRATECITVIGNECQSKLFNSLNIFEIHNLIISIKEEILDIEKLAKELKYKILLRKIDNSEVTYTKTNKDTGKDEICEVKDISSIIYFLTLFEFPPTYTDVRAANDISYDLCVNFLLYSNLSLVDTKNNKKYKFIFNKTNKFLTTQKFVINDVILDKNGKFNKFSILHNKLLEEYKNSGETYKDLSKLTYSGVRKAIKIAKEHYERKVAIKFETNIDSFTKNTFDLNKLYITSCKIKLFKDVINELNEELISKNKYSFKYIDSIIDGDDDERLLFNQKYDKDFTL